MECYEWGEGYEKLVKLLMRKYNDPDKVADLIEEAIGAAQWYPVTEDTEVYVKPDTLDICFRRAGEATSEKSMKDLLPMW